MKQVATVKPISPDDIPPPQVEDIPSVVFEAFNELIRERFDHKDKSARVMQHDVYRRIKSKNPNISRDLDNTKWMFKALPFYIERGWGVLYDKLFANDYNHACFVFSKKKE